MGYGKELDAAGRAHWTAVTAAIVWFLAAAVSAFPQANSTQERIEEVKALYDGQRWEAVVAATENAPETPGDFGLYRGLALARLGRWDEAEKALKKSLARNAGDARLRTELAGLAYRRKDFKGAKKYLQEALKKKPTDGYGNNLLASIYLLEGNLEAGLKYWNRAEKPRLSDLTFEPQPRLKPILLDRAFDFSRGGVWKQEGFLRTRAQLEGLEVFQAARFDLEAKEDGTFDLALRATEKAGWGDSPWIAAMNLASGTPYQTVYAEFPELNRAGLQWNSMIRWDDEKRRVTTELAAPLKDNPQWRFRFQVDLQNENWNLTNTFLPAAPRAAGVNLEKATTRVGIEAIPSGRWNWSAGVDYSYRRMRNPVGLPLGAAPFFTNGSGLGLQGSIGRALARYPERQFTVDGRVKSEAGTFFNGPLGRYVRMEGDLDTRWLPRAQGEDYETRVRLRAGKIWGDVPFDELYVLGFDRDTELWMRGHPGLLSGEKGNAPLGRGFALVNAELDKVVYRAPFVMFRAGPFLDTGETYDPSGYFGAERWMWDTGVQAKIRVLGAFEFVLGYGKDVRSGSNSFFTTVTRPRSREGK